MERRRIRRQVCRRYTGATSTATAMLLETLEARRFLSSSMVTVGIAEDGLASFDAHPDAVEVADEIVPGGVILREVGGAYPLAKSGGSAGRFTPVPDDGPGVNVGSFDIVLKKGPNLTGNAAASAAFDAAAAFLETFISDPVTVIIDAEVAPLSPGVIGSTSPVIFADTYTTVRDLVVNGRAANESIAASIPTMAQFVGTLPPQGSGSPYFLVGMHATRANLLGLGVPGADLNGPPSAYDPSVDRDMSITFSTNFAFDYDRSNGIGAGLQDFVGVAIHEIAHGLGFTSALEYIDATVSNTALSRGINPMPIDLYRLQPGAGAANFTGAARVLAPGNFIPNHVFYDGGLYDSSAFSGLGSLTTGDIPMSTGVQNGDGRQGSHWKDNNFTGLQIGILDPSASSGTQLNWAPPDTRAIGLIGWDIAFTSTTTGAPDLVAAFDSGSSNSDNRTNRDNSGNSKTLQFTVTGTTSGATVTVYSGTTAIGSAVATGATTTVTSNGTIDLADGVRAITVRQTEPTKSASNNSAALNVTIDTAAPTADVVDVSPDPRNTSVSAMTITFNKAVSGFNLADLSLTRNGGSNLLTGSQTLTTADNITFSLNNLSAITAVSGTYVLTLTAAGSGITETLAGNALVANASDTWAFSHPAWLAAASVASWNSSTKVLTVTGAATIIADPAGDTPTVNASGAAAILTINPASGLLIRVNALSLTGGATATVTSLGGARTAANHRVLRVQGGTLTIDANSTLNLTDNDLIVDYIGASLASGVEAMVRAGYNVTGDWLGKRITSSVAANDGNFVLAVADNAALSAPFGIAQGGQLFAGQDVDLTTVLVKFTHRADLNLDGLVTPDDSAVFGGNYDENQFANWATGDLNFDGLFTPDDAAIFGGAYDESLPLV